VNRVATKLLFFVVLILISSKSVFADIEESGKVTATILSQSFNPPILISPANNSAVNNPIISFSWNRPDPIPVTPLHHYDFYLDDNIFASSISDSINTQEYYYYNITRDNNVFHLDMKYALSEGYHTWKVIAYNSGNISVSSETWKFYIDSITPFISLTNVDTKSYNWNTSIPSSIPDLPKRFLTVNTTDPLLKGNVEPFSNMQIVLLCPQNILNCHNQIWTGNYPSGRWEHRFYGLQKGFTYTALLSATDAAGNSIIFPKFFLTYGPVLPTPFAIITPTGTISPTASVTPKPTVYPTLTPTPEYHPTEIIPIIVEPVPPVSPTPPLEITPPTPKYNFFALLLLLIIVFGLPLHLLMSIIGTGTPIKFIPKFLFILAYPFIGNKKYQSIPLTSLLFYNAKDFSKPWQIKVTDIFGRYSLKEIFPEKIFLKMFSSLRQTKDVIMLGSQLPIICIFAASKAPTNLLERFQKTNMSLRWFPLIIAIITSSIAFVIKPSYFLLIYLYLSLQYTFSEYLYPRINK